MIRSFADAETKQLFRDDECPSRWQSFRAVALRKLDMVEAAVRVEDLRAPPGNRLEKLKGDRRGRSGSTTNGASSSVGTATRRRM